jgi:glycine reductase
VLLGSPDPDSTEIFAQTVISGDPSYAGPLAGVSLDLDVFHVLEPEVRSVSSISVYDSQVGLMMNTLDSDSIITAIRRVRSDTKRDERTTP